ncbi:MAG: ABC transporter ATP-binding protein [Planctomycetia bacterium]|jgi:putative ABC transport system ATP-binding protein|nr:ABC transporter ATP-binding protein [Planctomycetia bacterium]MCC7314492.1 ABC transporter ATP-binding protein [Planctomycetota bacterium]
MAAIVEIEDLHKHYRLGDEIIPALRGINLSVAHGAFVAIMGASGSGKTTLMHLIGGLDLPDRGRILVEGRNVHALSDEERTLFRRRRLGIVFQAFNLMPTLTALENIMLPLLVDSVSQSEARSRADEMISLVRLSHRTRHRPAMLSGGEQQRAAIARALMNRPAVLLADEPTGNLDPSSAAAIWQIFRDLTADGATTVIMVTHEAEAAAHADLVHVIKDGQITGTIEPKGCGDANLVATRYASLAN